MVLILPNPKRKELSKEYSNITKGLKIKNQNHCYAQENRTTSKAWFFRAKTLRNPKNK
jgi:hypothetical protein